MTLNQLQYFMSLASRLNFRAVAEKYFITQPTLSRQIASLEEELNVKLFERSKHGVELTAAGKVLQEGLPSVYQDLTSLLLETQEVSAMGAKHLTISVQDDQVLSDRIMDAINQFREDEPNVHIRLERASLSDLYTGLVDQKIDLANVLDLDGHLMKDFQFVELSKEASCIAMQSGCAFQYKGAMSPQQADELLKEVQLCLVTLDSYDSVGDPIQSARSNLGMEIPESFCTIDSKFESMPLKVAAGLCVTISNSSHIMSLDPQVSLVPVSGANEYRKGILYRLDNPNPALTKFLQYL
jgi:DNA-binding transcriptional LysR family regulator